MKIIEEFNYLGYNNQCEYIENKFLSLDLDDIQYIKIKIIKCTYTILVVN